MTTSPSPPCPLTGAPAKRRIARISRRFLVALWRYSHRVDVSRFVADVDAVALWESPCGLAFFDPMVVGDRKFYADLYGRKSWHALLTRHAATRSDFAAAGRHVQPGQRVLDVGCGDGSFRVHVPDAIYTGLDPHVAFEHAGPGVRRETLAEHLETSAELYDAVCAFQSIEHVADPLNVVRAMLEALKPGGLLLLSAPHWPSPLTEIPNFVLNAPPHHVTWWNEAAYRTLCSACGLGVVEISRPPAYPLQGPALWVHRYSRLRSGETFYRASRWWYASVLAALPPAWLASTLKPLPKGAEPIDVFLAARKPA